MKFDNAQDVKFTEEKSSSKLALVATVFMVATAGLAFVTADTYATKVTLPKNAFICTKIEQVGKNLDDVICVQYTAQKFSKEAVTLNQLAAR